MLDLHGIDEDGIRNRNGSWLDSNTAHAPGACFHHSGAQTEKERIWYSRMVMAMELQQEKEKEDRSEI